MNALTIVLSSLSILFSILCIVRLVTASMLRAESGAGNAHIMYEKKNRIARTFWFIAAGACAAAMSVSYHTKPIMPIVALGFLAFAAIAQFQLYPRARKMTGKATKWLKKLVIG